jgi:phosphatidylglycerophosphatase C
LVLFKLKMRSAQRIKEQVLAHFFAGMTVKEFDILCYRFCLERLPQLIRPSALERIRYHQEQEHLVYIVSASVENWVRPWAHQHGVSVIASRLDNRAGIITGKLAGLNCNGPEKVARIQKEVYVPSDIRVYAYGDTSGDRPMLALATDRGFRIFND